MKCPECGFDYLQLYNTRNMRDGRVFRQRQCENCGKKFVTIEAYVSEGEKPCPNMFRRTAAVVWDGTDENT